MIGPDRHLCLRPDESLVKLTCLEPDRQRCRALICPVTSEQILKAGQLVLGLDQDRDLDPVLFQFPYLVSELIEVAGEGGYRSGTGPERSAAPRRRKVDIHPGMG